MLRLGSRTCSAYSINTSAFTIDATYTLDGRNSTTKFVITITLLVLRSFVVIGAVCTSIRVAGYIPAARRQIGQPDRPPSNLATGTVACGWSTETAVGELFTCDSADGWTIVILTRVEEVAFKDTVHGIGFCGTIYGIVVYGDFRIAVSST